MRGEERRGEERRGEEKRGEERRGEERRGEEKRGEERLEGCRADQDMSISRPPSERLKNTQRHTLGHIRHQKASVENGWMMAGSTSQHMHTAHTELSICW